MIKWRMIYDNMMDIWSENHKWWFSDGHLMKMRNDRCLMKKWQMFDDKVMGDWENKKMKDVRWKNEGSLMKKWWMMDN